MRPADVSIWERFMQKNPDRFLQVWYDYKVGGSAPIADDVLESARQSWYDLTRWAADVVAEDTQAIYVIEVKPLANAKALGQAIAYATLFIDDIRPKKPVYPVILTDHIIESTKRVADAQNVLLWEA